MNLIGRNKIVEYIHKHPESRIPLLIFLREFPYRQDPYPGDLQKVTDGTFQVDGLDCLIKVQINHFAKAINIIRLCTRAEEMIGWKDVDPEKWTIKVSFTVLVPPPPDGEEIAQLEELNSNKTNANLVNSGLINRASHPKDLYSEAEYEQCLNRVNAIFSVKPGVPEFEELMNLLPGVFNYEEYKLKFPKLKIFELVKNRMDLFAITPDSLGHLTGHADELNLFLSGKRIFENGVLTELYDVLALRSPVTDQRFFDSN